MSKKKKKPHFANANRSPIQPAPTAAPIAAQSRAVAMTASQTNLKPEAASSAKQGMAQKRAKHALEKISELENQGQANGHYVSYVKALPATIRLNGLGQAMAMEKAKGKLVGHKKLFEHVEDWLLGEGCPWDKNKIKGKDGNPDLFSAIINGSQADYLRAHAEALAYLDWLKKFAVAMLKEPKDGGDA